MAVNRTQLIQRIKTLEGLSSDERSSLLDLLRTTPKYGLVWENKPEKAEQELEENIPALREIRDKFVVPGGGNLLTDSNLCNHILIEGENLHALTSLTYTHEGKIDVIYIDPPYNTGNKDFVYNDDYVDREDGYRHSKWLSFMAKRLRIAKQLLSDRGVIFISIDDNEQAQLKLLCDEIFGQEKFVANMIWQKKTGAADAKGIANITEYILVYCLDISAASEIFAYNKAAFDIKRYRFTDEFLEKRGPFYFDSLDRGSIQYSDGLNYGIEAPDGTQIFPNGRTSFERDGWTWKWSSEKVDWGLKNGFIDIQKTNKKANGWAVKYKIYLNVDNEGNEISKAVPYKNLITGILNADAASIIKDIFNAKAFNYAKPLELIKLFLSLIRDDKVIILDFFAGSGTTLHATMQLNAEDGGKRQCILVTNNENGICENVTYERNKRVIQGYTTPKGVEVQGLTGNVLRYYRTELLPRERTQKNMRALVVAATDMLCIKNDIYNETGELGGQKMRTSLARHFRDDNGEMLVIYDDRAISHIVDRLRGVEVSTKIKVYVFSPNDYPYTDEFYDVADKVELCALPDAIYKAYSKVLKKTKPRLLTEEEEGVQ